MKIHLFVAHHNDVKIPTTSCIIPIRTDRADGINISTKEDYCELRAQYWVWSNILMEKDDYVGFFHFRRYLNFNCDGVISPATQKRPLPYTISHMPNPKHYSPERIAECVCGFDAIAPIWEYTGISVLERYSQYKKQRGEDLQLIYLILKEKFPQFIPAAELYLSGKGEYYGNMFLMRRSLFEKYCEWLFTILDEFDCRVVSPPTYTNGYLGERLFGIYFTWLQMQTDIICGELPRLHFSGYDDKEHRFIKQKIVNFFLPPGSKRKAILREFCKGEN